MQSCSMLPAPLLHPSAPPTNVGLDESPRASCPASDASPADARCIMAAFDCLYQTHRELRRAFRKRRIARQIFCPARQHPMRSAAAAAGGHAISCHIPASHVASSCRCTTPQSPNSSTSLAGANPYNVQCSSRRGLCPRLATTPKFTSLSRCALRRRGVAQQLFGAALQHGRNVKCSHGRGFAAVGRRRAGDLLAGADSASGGRRGSARAAQLLAGCCYSRTCRPTALQHRWVSANTVKCCEKPSKRVAKVRRR